MASMSHSLDLGRLLWLFQWIGYDRSYVMDLLKLGHKKWYSSARSFGTFTFGTLPPCYGKPRPHKEAQVERNWGSQLNSQADSWHPSPAMWGCHLGNRSSSLELSCPSSMWSSHELSLLNPTQTANMWQNKNCLHTITIWDSNGYLETCKVLRVECLF